MLKETLNVGSLVEVLIELPVISKAANTNDVKEALERFEITDPNAKEIQFLKDLFTLNTDEVVEKWYNKEALMKKVPEELR